MKKPSPSGPKRLLPRQDLLLVDRKWIVHYRTLVRLRDQLAGEELGRPARPVDGIAGEAPEPAPIRPGRDAAAIDQDFMRALLAEVADPIGELNDAIVRIIHGRYGICETTGLPIPPERLRAMPWVRHAQGRRQPERE